MKIRSEDLTCSEIKEEEFIVRNTVRSFCFKKFLGGKNEHSSYWSLDIPEFFKRR